MEPGVSEIPWGEIDGNAIKRYTLTNRFGMQLDVTNYGARLISLFTPDRAGELADVVLGFDSVQEYADSRDAMGATVGRVANRIRGPGFSIDDRFYRLLANEGVNTLHGGREFEHVVWSSSVLSSSKSDTRRSQRDTRPPAEQSICFSHVSPDGFFGFPGNLAAQINVTLSDENSVQFRFRATTDKATHVNFAHHSYFNLSGLTETIHNHHAWLAADEYLVLDEEALPTGLVESLDGKPWDLRAPTRLGDRMAKIPNGGYHHNYVLRSGREGAIAARLFDPESGRLLDVSTTQPSIVLYAAQGFKPSLRGKQGKRYGPHWGLCLETQHYVGAPNIKHFPSTLLRPGEVYDESVCYHFQVADALQPA
ncbi:MAG: aldose epimerase family protein [Pseudomonadota bacterium]